MKAIEFVIGAYEDLADYFVDPEQVLDVEYVTATDIVDSANVAKQVGGVAVLSDDATISDGIWHLHHQDDRNQGSLPSGFAWVDGKVTKMES